MAKHPVGFPTSSFSAISALVRPGEYQRFDRIEELPPDLAGITSYPDTDAFRTTVVMRASTSHNPPTIGGVSPAREAPVYRIATIRWDPHGTGPEHFNHDESLIFADTAGRAWRLPLRDQPDHFQRLSADSGLQAALDLMKLPAQRAGTPAVLADFGRPARFSTGTPGTA